jgi:UDP-N-acetyl-2-amino-2-deoxyglucuronate dehydrogenase
MSGAARRRRLALIGLGMAAGPHALSLRDLADRVEVAAAFSPTAQRRADFAARFPLPPADNLDAVLADRTIEAVAILTPPKTHLELVQRAAAAGKHVLLEKPLDITPERAADVVEVCRRADVTLAVMLQHRFRPAAMKLAAMLAAGELGTIVGCSASIRLWRPQNYYDQPGRGTRARDGGGVLLTQGIHTLDLMLHLAGPVSAVHAFAKTSAVHRMETEDLVCASLSFASGALGTVDATTTAYPGFAETIAVTGTTATALLAGTALEVFHHDGRTTRVAPDQSAGGTGADPMAFPHDYHSALIADFLDAIDEGRAPAVSGADALGVHRLIEAMLASSESGKVVTLAGA